MSPLVIIPILALGGGVAYTRAKKKKGITPDRRKIFQNALKSVKDPKQLRSLAASFDKEGLRVYGDELRKRAKLRELPDKVKEQRSSAFRKGMSSTTPAAITRLAQAFHREGAYGAAKDLRTYARGLSDRVANIFQSPRVTGESEEVEEVTEAVTDGGAGEELASE